MGGYYAEIETNPSARSEDFETDPDVEEEHVFPTHVRRSILFVVFGDSGHVRSTRCQGTPNQLYAYFVER